MSGSQIPYQLRPNKFIDRQLFMELLGRILPRVGNEKYIYISMGGRHLADHHGVYRQLGIRNLFSFDMDSDIVQRQLFNRPTATTICEEMLSGALPSKIDELSSKFSKTTNLVVWLDYTAPGARRKQLQELIEVLGKLQPNDILKITLNSHLPTLGPGEGELKKEGFDSVKEFRLEKLKRQLSDFVPTDQEVFDAEEFPLALSNCIGLAVSKAESQSSEVCFVPELITTYQDGHRMMTVTIRACRPDEKSVCPIELKEWQFRASDWSDMNYIEAPDLSTKERLRIDQYLNKSPRYILERLNFSPASNHDESLKVIKSYKRLHRYYPDFHHIEA